MKHPSLSAKITATLFLLALLLSLSACGEAPAEESTGGSVLPLPVAGQVQAADLLEAFTPQPVTVLESDERFALALLRLGSLLLKKTGEEKPNANLLVSPLSVMTALTMTANGAAGQTLSEMESVLGGDIRLDELNAYLAGWYQALSASEGLQLSFADAIWFKDEPGFVVKDSFLQTNADHFLAAIRKAPFDENTLRDINQWTDANTHHMIPSVLDPDDVMVLLNALSFEAKWADPFDENNIYRDAPFMAEDNSLRKADRMQATVRGYLEDDLCTGFRKDYEGGWSFIALKPRQWGSLKDFLECLNPERLQKLLSARQDVSVFIGLPKFSYDFGTDLAGALSQLGMPSAFSAADFSGITDSFPLAIGKVIHKTHIDLDSEGTKAAAVTAVTMRKNAVSVDPERKEVILDGPFVYLIVDPNNVPIFMGAVRDIP